MENELQALKTLRPVLGLIFYGSALWWLIGSKPLPLSLSTPDAIRWAGFAISLFGIMLFQRSVTALGLQYRGGIGLHDDHRLVTTGPYRLIRHPIYAAFIMIMIGVLFLTANLIVGLSGLILVSLIPILRIRKEEEELRARFTLDYDKYSQTTGSMLPLFRHRPN